jgi:hypothetical protein
MRGTLCVGGEAPGLMNSGEGTTYLRDVPRATSFGSIKNPQFAAATTLTLFGKIPQTIGARVGIGVDIGFLDLAGKTECGVGGITIHAY